MPFDNLSAISIRFSSTGYGEALMKAAFLLDEGEVETVAHYYAAAFFSPDVDCILDIGGQDMKCIKIISGGAGVYDFSALGQLVINVANGGNRRF